MVICMIPWMEVFLSAFRLNERTLEEVREFTSAMDAGGLKKIKFVNLHQPWTRVGSRKSETWGLFCSSGI